MHQSLAIDGPSRRIHETVLTSDLIRVRRSAGKIIPRYLRKDARERLLPIAQAFIETQGAMIGQSRDEIQAALDSIPIQARDRVAALGLRKVLDDRSEYDVIEGVDPEALRREVFDAAAKAHKELGLHDEFNRETVLLEVGSRLGITPIELDEKLYADLRGNEILREFWQLGAEALLDRYNLSLAQSILLRATRIHLQIEGESPPVYRNIFRAARFHGLIHTVRALPNQGYAITLDGPFSLFDAVQRYGLRLAMFVPSVLGCSHFKISAEVLWGPERQAHAFEILPGDGLISFSAEHISHAVDLEHFCAAFQKLESEWIVSQNDHIFALPGEIVCVPDLVFENRRTGEEVFLEAFGFWSREAVWKRIELIRKGFPARIILAVGKKLRVSEEVLGEEDAGELYVYGASLSPRILLDRLNKKNALPIQC